MFLPFVLFLAIERPDKNMGGLKRDQRQTAASGEPQTHRDGIFLSLSFLIVSVNRLVNKPNNRDW